MYQVEFIIPQIDKNHLVEKLDALGASSISTIFNDDETILVSALFFDLQVLKQLSDTEYTIKEIKEEDWKYTWLENFDGVKINDNIFIKSIEGQCPTDTYRFVIELDARDAFGAGNHPTTHLCLEALYKIVESIACPERKRVSMLDMGTGTGVLAICAALMDIGTIDAVDIDIEAVKKTIENARHNQIATINVHNSDVSSFIPEKDYDIICANLLTNIIIKNIDRLISYGKERSIYIISGISDIWHNDVMALFSEKNLEVNDYTNREGWNCYVIEKL